MKTTELIERMAKTFEAGVELARRKNSDYAGTARGEDAFFNFRSSVNVGVSPRRAILVRMSDKLSRCSTLLDRPPEVEDEAIRDTLIDIANYAAILEAMIASGDA